MKTMLCTTVSVVKIVLFLSIHLYVTLMCKINIIIRMHCFVISYKLYFVNNERTREGVTECQER